MGVTIALALLSLVLVARAVLGRDESAACWPERKLAVKIGLMAAWILIYVIGFIFLGEYAYDAEWPEGTWASSSPRWFSSLGRRC